MLSDKKFKEKLKYICPFEYDLIYDIMELYSECAKGTDIMIKDPILTKQVDHTMRILVKLVKEGGTHKRYVQILHGDGIVGLLRGVKGHFVGNPTLIFRALLTYEI